MSWIEAIAGFIGGGGLVALVGKVYTGRLTVSKQQLREWTEIIKDYKDKNKRAQTRIETLEAQVCELYNKLFEVNVQLENLKDLVRRTTKKLE